MSNERDELARVIAGTRFKAGTRRPQSSLEQADSILAAGYRKPRTITTQDGIEALANGTVIRDPLGHVWQRFTAASWRSTDGFVFLTPTLVPATVIYEPEPQS